MHSLQLVVAQTKEAALPGKRMQSLEAFQLSGLSNYKPWMSRQLAVSKEALIQMFSGIITPVITEQRLCP